MMLPDVTGARKGTHHHLVDGVDDVVHLLSRDVPVVVDVVKSESP